MLSDRGLNSYHCHTWIRVLIGPKRSYFVIDIEENIFSKNGEKKGTEKPGRIISIFKASKKKAEEAQTRHLCSALIFPEKKNRESLNFH